jgi:hypothetical protein
MTYQAEQPRRILKAEQAEFIRQAIDRARTAPPAYEGSLDPTGSVEFLHKTIHEAFEHYADLKAQGWQLEHSIPVCANKLFSFVAIKPDEVFEADIPQIAVRAEQAYAREVESHNKEAQKHKERAEFIESEFKRLEEQRMTQLREDLAKQYDNRGRTSFINTNGDDVRLHA